MKIEQIDYSINTKQSIIWQYENASTILSLVNQKQTWYDLNQSQFWADWYTDVFNLVTANDFGLSVWSIILDVPYLISSGTNVKPIWGFNELPTVNHYVNFNRGTFANISSSRIVLTTEEQRIFLRLRYFQLTSDGTIPLTNQFLDLIFNDPLGLYQGGAWAVDNFDMTMMYFFNCPISNSLLQVLIQYDILPRPDGVDLTYVVLGGLVTFTDSTGNSIIDNNFDPIVGQTP